MSHSICNACEWVSTCTNRQACIPLVQDNGGRFVHTHTHEAPRWRVPITLAEEESVFHQESTFNRFGVSLKRAAVVLVAALVATAFYFRPL